MKLTQTVCVGVFPGAPDRERGGGAAEGQTPQHHHVDRGGGHVIWTLPGDGARQGSLDARTKGAGECKCILFFGELLQCFNIGAGWRSVRRHHLLGQIHREGRLRHGVQPGRSSEVPAQHQHRPQGHKTGEPAGMYQRSLHFLTTNAAVLPALAEHVPHFQVFEYPDGTKSLKLGDFGLATVVEGPLYTVCGTPTYVAPEIIAESGYDGRKKGTQFSLVCNMILRFSVCFKLFCLYLPSVHSYGLKVDIWAAGVITYILLCGFPPFRRYLPLVHRMSPSYKETWWLEWNGSVLGGIDSWKNLLDLFHAFIR